MKLTSLLRAMLTRSFRPFLFESDRDPILEYGDAERLGLYVHIPFCRSICGFCPYCKTVYEKERSRRYLEALLAEIRRVGEMGKGRREVTSLYFGGGTPALMADELGLITGELKRWFDIGGQIGAELHPEDVTVETLEKLKAAGVTMLSIGIQSFQRDSLERLGRTEPPAKAIAKALSQVPFESVSMDLIFALPGQTADRLKEDIRTAFELGADQIAAYPFIDFTFADNEYRPVPEREKKRMLREITDYCRELGCVRTSVWTFGKPGKPKYSSMTREQFLGFGPSAATLLSDQFKINTFDLESYIARTAAEDLPTALTLRFTGRQRMIYHLFWEAYTTEVDPDNFQRLFARRLEDCFGWELILCRLLGLAKKEPKKDRPGHVYRMTGRGAYYYHFIEQYYTLSYIDRMWNVLGREPFPKELRM